MRLNKIFKVGFFKVVTLSFPFCWKLGINDGERHDSDTGIGTCFGSSHYTAVERPLLETSSKFLGTPGTLRRTRSPSAGIFPCLPISVPIVYVNSDFH